MTAPTTTPGPTPAQLFLPRTRLTLTPRQVLLRALPPNEALGCDPPERALVNDITALGVLQPVILVQTPAGRYTVADGRNRIWAARQAGLTAVPALVVPAGQIAPSAIGAKANALRRANPRTRLSFVQEAEAAGLDDRAICAVGGFSAAELKATRKVLDLIPALHAAFTAGTIPASVAHAAAGLTPDQQEMLAARLATEGTLRLTDVRAARRVAREESVAQLSPALFATPNAGEAEPWPGVVARHLLHARAALPPDAAPDLRAAIATALTLAERAAGPASTPSA
jgi:ParB family chromosome partitioning protein